MVMLRSTSGNVSVIACLRLFPKEVLMLIQRCYIPLLLACLILLPFSSASANEASKEIKTMLSSMERDAENIVDTALAKDAAGSRKLYKKIQQRMDQLHHSLAGKPFDERRSRELLMAYSWMRVIAMDIKQQAWVGAAIAANQLTASTIRFTHYPTLLQRDTAWMDYLARELLLLNMEAASANAQLLNARRANIVETWARIKKTLIRKSFRNKPLVFRGDNLIHLLQKNHSAETTMTTARKLLDFVDKIERVQ